MKGLTGRLIVSYITLAAATLLSAGALTYAGLAADLHQADQERIQAELYAAGHFALLWAQSMGDTSPERLAEELSTVFRGVRATVVNRAPSRTVPSRAGNSIVVPLPSWRWPDLGIELTWTDPVGERTAALARALVGSGLAALAAAVLWPSGSAAP